MQEVLAEMMGIEPELLPADPNGMYIATCNQGISGAGCIFYPDFMKQASDKFGGSFFVLPSSVHEMIILPDNGLFDYKNLQNMVQEINASEVRPEDRLSDSVYHYDTEDRIFEKASNYESRQQAKSTENEKSNAKASIMGKLADKKKETISGPAEKRTASKTVENSLQGGTSFEYRVFKKTAEVLRSHNR